MGCGGGSGDDGLVRFLLRIENIGADAITTSEGTTVPAVFAPGALVVNQSAAPLFITGEPAAPGLEIMAEDGGGMLLAEEASALSEGAVAMAFAIPEGETEGGPLTPGNSYVVEFEARRGDYLNFATMFVQSNDLFVSPTDADGVPVFDRDGNPRSGDITAEMALWDAGTEVNQEPGLGPDQAPRQAGPNTGADEGGVVRLTDETDFPLPPLDTTVTVTITPIS